MSSRLDAWERRTAPFLTALAGAALVTLVLEARWCAACGWWRASHGQRHGSKIERVAADEPPAVLGQPKPDRVVDCEHRPGQVVQRRGCPRVRVEGRVLIASTVLLAGASVGLEAERDAPGANITSFGDAMWWGLTTVTTVGYGDRYPVTPEGRVIGGVLMIVGIATMGAVTAAIASQLINPHAGGSDERIHALEAEITRLSAQLEGWRSGLSPRRRLCLLHHRRGAVACAACLGLRHRPVGGGRANRRGHRVRARTKFAVTPHRVSGNDSLCQRGSC
jgi:Ion channel